MNRKWKLFVSIFCHIKSAIIIVDCVKKLCNCMNCLNFVMLVSMGQELQLLFCYYDACWHPNRKLANLTPAISGGSYYSLILINETSTVHQWLFTSVKFRHHLSEKIMVKMTYYSPNLNRIDLDTHANSIRNSNSSIHLW